MPVAVRSRRGYGPLGRFLRPRARRLLRLCQAAEAELSVLLCGDEEMARLNLAYRGREGPTDVLSFPMLEPGQPVAGGQLLGDVVICVDQARRQCRGGEAGLRRELLLLLVHGTLHLLGYDHESGDVVEARRMAVRQRQLLSLLAGAGGK